MAAMAGLLPTDCITAGKYLEAIFILEAGVFLNLEQLIRTSIFEGKQDTLSCQREKGQGPNILPQKGTDLEKFPLELIVKVGFQLTNRHNWF